MPSNEKRANRVADVLSNIGELGSRVCPEEDTIDLLTDLMHYCAREGVHFNSCLDMARHHYEEEK